MISKLEVVRTYNNLTFNNLYADNEFDKITEITFDYDFNQLVKHFPPKLTTLNFLSYQLNLDDLPRGLIKLRVGNDFNNPVNNLPDSLEILDLGDEFNKPVDSLPNSLKHLSLGYSFNQPIDMLPNSLVSLYISDEQSGSYFNQTVDNLPNSLENLSLGSEFNQPIDNLPCSIIKLSLGENFNQPINNFIINKKHNQKYFNPSLLLTLGSKFNQYINNEFNIPLTIYFIDNNKYNKIKNVLIHKFSPP